MSWEGRLSVGQRVRDSTLGLGTIIEDLGEPEDRGAYAIKFDNGEELWGMARFGLEVAPDDETQRQEPLHGG